MFTINHGTITLSTNANAWATVDVFTFPNFTQTPHNPIPTKNVKGVLTLKAPPNVVGRYDKGNVLHYSDGNNNNNLSMAIDSVVGPSKYNITVD